MHKKDISELINLFNNSLYSNNTNLYNIWTDSKLDKITDFFIDGIDDIINEPEYTTHTSDCEPTTKKSETYNIIDDNYTISNYITIGFNLSNKYDSNKDMSNDIKETVELVAVLLYNYNFEHINIKVIPGKIKGFTLFIDSINFERYANEEDFENEINNFRNFLTTCLKDLELTVVMPKNNSITYYSLEESLKQLNEVIKDIRFIASLP